LSAGKDIVYTAGAGDFSVLFNSPVTTGSIVVSLILAVILFLIYTPARINFARREKFSAGFDFSVIFKMIKKLGPGKYILGLLLLIPVALLFGIALYILILAVTFIAVFAVMLLSLSTELIIGIVIAVSVIIGVPSCVIYLITMVKYLSGLFVPDEDNAVITASEENTCIDQEESPV
ncbi:MAG TPA: DUF4013 domain-containing protein, partial [Methanocorpusculum sp.]|nr:DUF4013 domain-containing protein [Methanocorpusculum sp.]